jgi:hypothetical protein
LIRAHASRGAMEGGPLKVEECKGERVGVLMVGVVRRVGKSRAAPVGMTGLGAAPTALWIDVALDPSPCGLG